MASQPAFFDIDDQYGASSAAGDPLERFSGVIDFEFVRSRLLAALRRSDRSKEERPPTIQC